MTTYEEVAARVSAVARVLHRTLLGVTVMLAVAAIGLFVGIGSAGDWGVPGLVVGAILGGAVVVLAVVVAFFVGDLGRIRELHTVSRQQIQDAATQLGSRAREGQQRFLEAKGWRKLLRVAQALRTLKADIEDLGEGGLAPAVSLAQALVPPRILAVTAISVAAPLILAVGLFVLVVGLVLA